MRLCEEAHEYKTMYIYIKIGKRVFTFGKDRKGVERRRDEAPVEEEHRRCGDRRMKEPSDKKCSANASNKEDI